MRGGSFPAEELFAPTHVWTNRGDSISFLNGPHYRIDMSVGGSPELSIRRPLDAPGIPAAFVSDSTFVALRLEEFGETILALHRVRTNDGTL